MGYYIRAPYFRKVPYGFQGFIERRTGCHCFIMLLVGICRAPCWFHRVSYAGFADFSITDPKTRRRSGVGEGASGLGLKA